MDKLKYIKFEESQGQYTNSIPIGVDSKNVDLKTGYNLEETLGDYDYSQGTIEDRLKKIKTDKTLTQQNVAADAKTVGDFIKRKPTVYETIAEMVNDKQIIVGEKVETLGYNTINDGEAATYQIVNNIPNTKYQILKNGLYAKQIFHKTPQTKLMWSIQTNVDDGVFYGLAASIDGLGHTLVEGYSNFIDTNEKIGSDWLHFQKEDYHVFTITHYSSAFDFYIAITKDFETWIHKGIKIGLRETNNFVNPYVWTPQIFEFKNELYIAATVQEGEPIENGNRYQTMTRFSAIYVARINLNYETGDINIIDSSFTRIKFSNITDRQGEVHNITGQTMDAWFVPIDNKLYCVFNDRYMLQIHSAVANDIKEEFIVLNQNIFKTINIEAPTVLKISDNLYKISACIYGGNGFFKEENVCCYTSDFINFYNYQFMKRIDIKTNNSNYTRRMRNPSFFYMTDNQEHNFLKKHNVKTNGYSHIFKSGVKPFNYLLYHALNYTDIALPQNIKYQREIDSGFPLTKLALSDIYGENQLIITNVSNNAITIKYDNVNYTLFSQESLNIKNDSINITGRLKRKTALDVMTLNEDYSSANLSNVSAIRIDGIKYLRGTIGSLSLVSGSNNIATLEPEYCPSIEVVITGFVGTSTNVGQIVKVLISSNGNINVATQEPINGTLRFAMSFY